jgi:hypothetical protein
MAARRKLGPPGEGYTYFGGVFYRLLRERGHNQSSFAAECRRRGIKLGGPGGERDVGQRSVSDWMRGKVACPREIPNIATSILDLSDEERIELALAFAYGQKVQQADAAANLVDLERLYRARVSTPSSLISISRSVPKKPE